MQFTSEKSCGQRSALTKGIGRLALRGGDFGPGHREVTFDAVELAADSASVSLSTTDQAERVEIDRPRLSLGGTYLEAVATSPGGDFFRSLEIEQARFGASSGKLVIRQGEINAYADFAGGGFVQASPGKMLADGSVVSLRLLFLPRTNPPSGRSAVLLSYQGSAPSSGFQVSLGPDGKIAFSAVHTGGSVSGDGSDALALNRVTELLLAFNGKNWRMWQDGFPLPPVPATGPIVVPPDGTALTCGGGPSAQSLDGWIAEAQVWHAALDTTSDLGGATVANSAALLLEMTSPLADTSPNKWPVKTQGSVTVGPLPFGLQLTGDLGLLVTDLSAIQTPTANQLALSWSLSASGGGVDPANPIHSLSSSGIVVVDLSLTIQGLRVVDGQYASDPQAIGGTLTLAGATSLFGQVHPVAQASKTLAGIRGVRPFPIPQPSSGGTTPPPVPQSQELIDLTFDLGREEESSLAAGLYVTFDQALIQLGSGTSLTIAADAGNLLRLNQGQALPMQQNQVFQFRANQASLVFPDPANAGKTITSNLDGIALDALVRNYTPGLSPPLRALADQIHFLFGIEASIPPITMPAPDPLRIDLDDLGAVKLALQLLQALLDAVGSGISGIIGTALGWAGDAVSFVLGAISEVSGVRPGLAFQATDLTAGVFTDPLPPPITPNTANQIVFFAKTGLRRVFPYIAYTLPTFGWDTWHPTVSFENHYLDGPDILPGEVDFDFILRLTLQYDSVSRRVLIGDVETWLVPDAGPVIEDITLATEEVVKQILGTVLRLTPTPGRHPRADQLAPRKRGPRARRLECEPGPHPDPGRQGRRDLRGRPRRLGTAGLN